MILLPTKKISLVLALLALTALTAGPARAQQIYQLTALPAPGDVTTPTTYLFPPEDAGPGQGASHVFTLRNDNNFSVTISKLGVSCPCMTAVLQAGGAHPLGSQEEEVLTPGQETQVEVSVSFANDSEGLIDRVAMVYLAGQTQPGALLHMTGSIVHAILFIPASHNFSNAPTGTVAAKMGVTTVAYFAIGISPRAPDPGPAPLLTSTIPGLTIVPYTNPITRPDFPSGYRYWVYEAILPPDEPMGPLEGSINYGKPLPTPPQNMGLDLIARGPSPAPPPADKFMASFPVQGDLQGDLFANPDRVDFGSIPGGKPVSRTVDLSGSGYIKNLASIRFSSDRPWLSAHIAGRGDAPLNLAIEIDIDRTAPIGPQSANIIGDMGTGDSIRIPVKAIITSAPR